MREKWHNYYEMLKFQLALLFTAVMIYGLGNLITNTSFSSLWLIKNQYILVVAEAFMRLAQFLIVYFPLFFLIKLVSKPKNGVTKVVAGIIGYITFEVFTIFFADSSLPSAAFSPILGISITSSRVNGLAGSTHYPIQTGIIGIAVVAYFTVTTHEFTKNHSQYDFMGFIDRDLWVTLVNMIPCAISGVLVAWAWPFMYEQLNNLFVFISRNINNPMNLFIYGVTERLLNVLNLASLIRTPFWFGTQGGTWVNLVGENVAGDVNAWTASLAAGALQVTSGRFITPYYVMNMFAMPGLILGLYSLYTDKMEKRKVRVLVIIAILTSLLSGCSLPIELLLALLCPLLFILHVLYTGSLFGVFKAVGCTLGFNYKGTSTLTALPGTLPEFLTYVNNADLRHTINVILIIGAITFLLYFIMTRVYFKYLALDLFNTGGVGRMSDATIRAVGGTANIKMIHSSINRLTIQVFDPTLFNVKPLREFSSVRVSDSKAGFVLNFGAGSTIIANAINKELRESLRK